MANISVVHGKEDRASSITKHVKNVQISKLESSRQNIFASILRLKKEQIKWGFWEYYADIKQNTCRDHSAYHVWWSSFIVLQHSNLGCSCAPCLFKDHTQKILLSPPFKDLFLFHVVARTQGISLLSKKWSFWILLSRVLFKYSLGSL